MDISKLEREAGITPGALLPALTVFASALAGIVAVLVAVTR